MGFNFEKNLIHQTQAVNNSIAVFENVKIKKAVGVDYKFINPAFDIYDNFAYIDNLHKIKDNSKIEECPDQDSRIIDIMMETGTGKTYTYTKTIFELNKNFNIFKFVVIVPTLSIKAGTIDFLKSDSSREHFKEQYGKIIRLHIVSSKKRKRNKKSFIPPAISSFVNAGLFEKNQIQVMIINAGMINSETMQKSFDTGIFDKYVVPFDAIAAVKPFLIIDEPHKFARANRTWENIQKMKPQFILRYGATFPEKEIKQKNIFGKLEKIKIKDYHNLIYTLTAVDSFNRNLVKGVIGHITEFEEGKNAIVKFVNSDGKEATFELTENNNKKTFKVIKKTSLEKIHSAMLGLYVEKLNKSTVVLSNGIDLKKGDKINPYSYAEKLQTIMIQKALKSHFELEKKYLTRDVKIKPITLFFIDNINEYRNENGYIKTSIEKLIKAEAENQLKIIQSELKTQNLKLKTNNYYKSFLEKTLEDISKTHGGYFSKDNTGKDEAIEKEIYEILHDKQAILSLENPRRFIFSKWTLREGWDNPNVFQICKLRSSGSEISKLQEVGRGLRLPVNEYGNRVKDEQFYLNYFVDFTENDFIDTLVNEINQKSGAISIEETPEKLTDNIIRKICDLYETKEDDLLELLDEKNLITRTNKFKENGFEYIKKNYTLIFEGVGSNKIRKEGKEKKKIRVRTEKYQELKDLWEKLNEKVILEYKFKDEANFKKLFTAFLNEQKNNFTIKGIKERKTKIEIKDKIAISTEEISVLHNKITAVSTIKYSEFIKELSKTLNINLKTLHNSFKESEIEINKYLNNSTIRIIKQNFDNYLMYNAIDKFSIEYKKVTNSIHPTKLTDKKGNVLKEINASDIGVLQSDDKVAENYFFDELFYDSELEKENIKTKIEEVIIFSKIPKNSIKIPVAGGKSYSPDFAYVVNLKNGEKKLYFIVETKNTNEASLRNEEKQKIKHAEKFFAGDVKIKFKTQFNNKKIVDLIHEVTNGI